MRDRWQKWQGVQWGDRWVVQVGRTAVLLPRNSSRRVCWTASGLASGWWSVGEDVSFLCTAQQGRMHGESHDTMLCNACKSMPHDWWYLSKRYNAMSQHKGGFFRSKKASVPFKSSLERALTLSHTTYTYQSTQTTLTTYTVGLGSAHGHCSLT